MVDNAVPPMKVGYNYPWAFDEYGFNFGPVFFPFRTRDFQAGRIRSRSVSKS